MQATSHRNRSYTARVLSSTFARRGAKLGAWWIAIAALGAVAAPLLANSHPLLWQVDGEISSPALEHLTSVDVVLLMGALGFVTGFTFRRRFAGTLKFTLTFTALGAILAAVSGPPPVLTVYEQYREMDKSGRVDWTITAPIPYSPKDYLRDFGDTGLEQPLSARSRTHWMGTDQNGADVASRMLHASRIALAIGLIATGIAMVIGVAIGALMGYFAGIVDLIGMRLVEIFEAVPTLFLLLTFVAFFGRSIYLLMIIIGITSWTGFARFVRAECLSLRDREFVQAAVVSGVSVPKILFRHLLPNAMGPVLVAASFGVASAILAEAVLSFLGLGLVDDPSWGQMLNKAVQSSTFNWWMALFPGGAIFATVLAYNLIGEAMRDAVDPKLSTHQGTL